jgi:sugar lactone lactonase YvrE
MTTGHIYTVAGTGKAGFSGDGGPATGAGLDNPDGVALDGAGNLLIADGFDGRVRAVAAGTGTFYGIAMTAGHIYTIAGGGTQGLGDGGPATAASILGPEGLALDSSGNLLIADLDDARIRVVAATSGTFYGQAMTADDIYTVAGDGTTGFSGDGGPATAAALSGPLDVSVDGAGNLLIADSENGRVRAVAASTGTFYGIAMTGGDIYTVAGGGTGGLGDGGPATAAELSSPAAATAAASGDLVIADTGHARIRQVAG